MRVGLSGVVVALLAASSLGVSALAFAGQQQASFSVAVTLHMSVKPLSPVELCRNGRPITAVGATIQVDCSRVNLPPQDRPAAVREATAPERPARPEVTVTF
ncbi:MAG TPA: hypothetical protein VIR81_14935 [Myxococcales bacterium]